MILINKNYLLSITLPLLLVLSNVNATRSFHSGHINEEDFIDSSMHKKSQETGKHDFENLKASLLSSSSSSSSSSASAESLNKRLSSKRYSNQEILLEEKDFDNDDLNLLYAPAQSASAANSKASAKLYINKKPKTTKHDDLDDDLLELARDQRTDLLNKHHYENLEELKNFHRNQQLQKELANHRDNLANFDYDFMSNLMFANNKMDDNAEKQMKPSEIGYLLKMTMKNGKDFNDADMDNNDELIDNIKPVKINVKEKIYLENEYFNKLKSDLEGQNQQNPFFNDAALDKMNLELLMPNEKYEGSSGSFNSHHPSLLKDQKSSNLIDPAIDNKINEIKTQNEFLFILVVGGCTVAGVVALIAAGVCWYSMHKSAVLAKNIESGGQGLTASGSITSKSSKLSSNSGDRRLAQSAQMYHYQHQKQQMIAMEKAHNDTKNDQSDQSDGETEEGDYTVYECPGLAPTGEMEVKNPLFKEEFSSQNLAAAPPPYSAAVNETKPTDQSAESTKNEVTIPVNDDEAQKH